MVSRGRRAIGESSIAPHPIVYGDLSPQTPPASPAASVGLDLLVYPPEIARALSLRGLFFGERQRVSRAH